MIQRWQETRRMKRQGYKRLRPWTKVFLRGIGRMIGQTLIIQEDRFGREWYRP